jgi:ketose-bisphosphate aldolase
MSIVGMDELLAHALKNKYAVGYFEAWEQYSLEAALEAAEEGNSPLILGFGGAVTNQSWLDGHGIEELSILARLLAERAKVPACVLLNEVPTFGEILRGLRSGCNAVMLDTSHLPYEENLRLTKKVTEVAHALGATVEAELGHLADGTNASVRAIQTNPEEAARFVAESGVDALAVSVGNMHILLGNESPVDLDLLARIHAAVPVPLVMHGGTGFPSSAIKQAIERGIAKFNVGTILKKTFLDGIQKAINALPEKYNIQEYLGCRYENDILLDGKRQMKGEIQRLMNLYGCVGQAKNWH